MTAAEILRNAEPPADDSAIEKAIAELDVKIWEWADALKSAHTQLRSAFAVRPAVTPNAAPVQGRPSAALFDAVPGLSAAAAAAHVPSPPPMPAEWTAPPAPASEWSAATTSSNDWNAPAAAPAPDWAQQQAAPQQQHDWAAAAAQTNSPFERPAQHGGHGASSASPTPPQQQPAWPQQPEQLQSSASGGVMAWPTAASGNSWPSVDSNAPATGVQQWPTWTPTDASQQDTSAKKKGSNVRASKAPRATRPVPTGPTPEERAQKAAAEESMLSELDEAIARRVRLLRRLDPDTAIEKLIEKARQGQSEGAAAQPAAARDDKSSSSSSSSWWRRK